MINLTGNIREISAFVPEYTIQNKDNPNFSEKDKFIFIKTTGIKQLHICQTSTADMAIKACEPLNKKGIDLIITVTQTPTVQIPGMSSLLQDYFKLNCGGIDLNSACNGFVQGLMVAYSFASHGLKSMIVFSELMSNIQDPQDKNSMIFGDGAVAMIVEPDGDNAKFILYSDGSRFESVWKPDKYLLMNGSAVFDFTMSEVFDALSYVVNDKIDYYVLHQSNLFILKHLAKRLNIPLEKMCINIDRYGNTSAVSIPLAMATEIPEGRLIACGYGAGLSWGTVEFYYKPENVYYYES